MTAIKNHPQRERGRGFTLASQMPSPTLWVSVKSFE